MSGDRFFSAKVCDRCGCDLRAHTLSKLNLDILCLDCKEDETHAPGYAAADAAELASVRRGERDFPGVGLTDEDRVFLATRRAARVNHPGSAMA